MEELIPEGTDPGNWTVPAPGLGTGRLRQGPRNGNVPTRRDLGSVGTPRGFGSGRFGRGDSRRGSSSPARQKGFGPNGNCLPDFGLKDNPSNGFRPRRRVVISVMANWRASARQRPPSEANGPPGKGFGPSPKGGTQRPLDRRDFGLVPTGAIGGCEGFLGEELRL